MILLRSVGNLPPRALKIEGQRCISISIDAALGDRKVHSNKAFASGCVAQDALYRLLERRGAEERGGFASDEPQVAENYRRMTRPFWISGHKAKDRGGNFSRR